jgi:hypothetical protein
MRAYHRDSEYRADCAREDEGRAEFLAGLGPDVAPVYERMTCAAAIRAVPCGMHRAEKGAPCGHSFGSDWSCTDRRVSAAVASVSQ